ncbi:MAG TPA: hypothetical protein VF642_11205 [Propionibacteriaceae bacterium]|jgi:hypothetical protein
MGKVTRCLLAALLVVAAVVWFRVNGPVEGKVLIVLSYNHGVTVADLFSVAAVLLAVALVWPLMRKGFR